MSDNKSFDTKRRSHVNTPSPKVHEESFENREKISTHRDWTWTPETSEKSNQIQYNSYDSFDAHWSKEIDQPKEKK